MREHGAVQFLHTFERVRDRTNDSLLWGDEVRCGAGTALGTALLCSVLTPQSRGWQVEYHVVQFDHELKTAKLALRAPELLQQLGELEKHNATCVQRSRPAQCMRS